MQAVQLVRRASVGWIVTGVLVLAGVSWASGAFADSNAPGRPNGVGRGFAGAENFLGDSEAANTFKRFISGRIGRMLVLRSDLNITDDQRQKLRTVAMSHRAEAATKISNLVEKKKALRTAVLADKPDEAAIRQAADELGKSIGDAAVLMSKGAGEAKQILTPEQHERVKKFLSEQDSSLTAFLNEIKSKQ